MKVFFIALLASSVLMCSYAKADTAPSKADAYVWGEETVNDLTEIYPDSFKEMSEKLAILDGFDFTKLNLEYDHTSNRVLSFTNADMNFLINVGIISSVARYCEMNWAEQNYLPMMQWQRSYLPASERSGFQIAVIAAIHGIAQGGTDNWLMENNAQCSGVRTTLSKKLFSDQF